MRQGITYALMGAGAALVALGIQAHDPITIGLSLAGIIFLATAEGMP